MALITDFISDPKSWCNSLKVSPQTVWLNEALEPIINNSGAITGVTTTPDTVFDSLYAYKHATTGTDTIMINTDNLPCPSYVDRNYNTVVINNPYKPIKYTIENPNKESEDKEVTETKKQPRMFYNANTYGKQFRNIRYGTSMKDSWYIMPEISDVRHIINKGDVIGVEIKFADNTKQKAICSPNDTFNLEQGISICLFKKILEDGLITSNPLCKGRGTSIYNKLVNHAIKVMERRIKAEEKAKKKEAEKKEKEQRFIEKKRRADERRAKRESEQRINEMAEAIRRSGVVPTNFTDDGK
jgi:hypothetical protein